MDILTALFISTTVQFNLPQDLLSSLCYVESKHDVTAIHHDDGNSDSLGVCQVKYETAKWLGFKGTAKDLMKPENNIYYAGKYLSKQINRYNNITKGIVAYNKGNAKSLTRSNYSDKVIIQWESKNNDRTLRQRR